MSSILFYSTRKSKTLRKKFFDKITYSKNGPSGAPGPQARAPGALKSHNAGKLKGGTLWDFSTSILSQNIKKMQEGSLGKKFFEKKSRSAEKNERGKPLVSPGMVCYAEKQEKPFWFSSLDQIVQFGAIIFCRNFVELFWSVRVDRKKRVTSIVAFHFMKRRLIMTK